MSTTAQNKKAPLPKSSTLASAAAAALPPPAKKTEEPVMMEADDFDLPEDEPVNNNNDNNERMDSILAADDHADADADDFMDPVAPAPAPVPAAPVAKKSSSSKKRKSPAAGDAAVTSAASEKSTEEKEAERQKKMEAVKLAGENYLIMHSTIKSRPMLIAVPGLGKAYLKHLVDAYRAGNSPSGQFLDSHLLPLAQKASEICALHEPHEKVLENEESTPEQKAKANEAIAALPIKPRVNDWMLMHLVPSFDPNKITAQGYHIRVKLIGPVHNHKALDKIDARNFLEQLPLSSISTTFKNINLPVGSYTDPAGLATRCKPKLHWDKFELAAPDSEGRQFKTALHKIIPFGVLTGEEALSWTNEQKSVLNRSCVYAQKMFSGIDDYKALAAEQQEFWDAYKTARQRDRKAMKERFNVELPDYVPCWFDHLQQRLEKADPNKDQSRIIYGANSIYNQESRRDRSASATGKKKGGASAAATAGAAESQVASGGNGGGAADSRLSRESQTQLFQSSLFPFNYVGRTYLHWIQRHAPAVQDGSFDRLAGINAAIASNVISIQPPGEGVSVRNSLLVRLQDELTGEIKLGFSGSVNPQSMALVGAHYWQYYRVLQTNAHLLATREAFNKQPHLFEEQFNTIVSNASNLANHYTEPLVALLLSDSPDVRNFLNWLEFDDWNHFVSVVGPELCNTPNLWDPVHQRPMANAALNIILYMAQHNLGSSAVENLMNWLDVQMHNYLNYTSTTEFTPSELYRASLDTVKPVATASAAEVPAGLVSVPGLSLPSVTVAAPAPAKRNRSR